MVTEFTLTHPCGGTVQLVAGAWTIPSGTIITHCPTCGEWLGSAFTRVEETTRPQTNRHQRQLPGVPA